MQYISHLITLGNLLAGGIGVIFTFQGQYHWGAGGLILGGVLDLLDGFVARRLNTVSDFGKQLDSLADLITFGMLPAGMMYGLIGRYTNNLYLPFIALLILIAAAWRLAKFNLQEEKMVFFGLPTPASAFFLTSFLCSIKRNHYPGLTALLTQPYILAGLVVVTSLLMIVPVPMMSLKFHSFAWHQNKERYTWLFTSFVLVIVLNAEGVILSIVSYIVLSLMTKLTFYKS